MNSYSEQQYKRDREYAAAWEQLSHGERKRLAKAGVAGPALPLYRTEKRDQESILLSCPAPVEVADDTHAVCHEDAGTVVRRLIGELMASSHTRLTIECLSLVTRISYDGASMTDIARRCGVTRAAVSKRCVEICNALGIYPSGAMRQLTARTVYERRARHSHSRSEH